MSLEIVRPDLSRFRKNFDDTIGGYPFASVEKETGRTIRELSAYLEGSQDVRHQSALFRLRQADCGVCICVSSEVSRSLEASKLSSAVFEDIPFPAKSAEIIWEDQELPNLLISLFGPDETASETRAAAISLTRKEENKHKDGKHGGWLHNSLLFKMHEIDGILRGDIRCETGPGWDEIPTEDPNFQNSKEVVVYMLELALKVLAYAAVAEVKSTTKPCTSKAEWRDAGMLSRGKKAGIPPKGVIHLQHLPRVVYANDAEAQEAQGGTHRFLGRIGHIRHYKSERYTEKVRGTWRFMPPIAPPEGIKLRYIVNKKP